MISSTIGRTICDRPRAYLSKLFCESVGGLRTNQSFRLCIDPSVCNELLRLGGLTRLLELCKEPMERNYSDAVLVACLAVVRRVRNNLKMDREGRR